MASVERPETALDGGHSDDPSAAVADTSSDDRPVRRHRMHVVRRGRRGAQRPMRVVCAVAGATAVAATSISGGSTICSAHATPHSAGINGTYTATSDGTSAKLNHQYKDHAVVTSTWTITSTCRTPMDCAGQVTSDHGWRADLHLVGGSLWIASHDVENWERCPDGTAFPGHQQFKFYRVDDNNLQGWDETTGPSGACGANQWLFIEMPLTLVKVG